MSTPEPKPRRPRKTKAERDAELAAQMAEEAAKPIDPSIWLILGGLLLVIGAFIYFDPVGFAEAGQPSDNTFLRTLFVLLVGIFGKNPTAIILIALGLLSLIWGVRGWLKARFVAGNK